MDNDQYKPASSTHGSSMQGMVQQDDQDDEGLALGEIIAVVFEYRWLVAAIIASAILLGLGGVFVAKPEYRASGLLEVEEKASGALAAMKDLGPLLGLGGDTTVAAEQEILGSRMVLEKVINKQKLNIRAEPRYFPLVGRAIARRYKDEGLNSPLFGLASFAWGGEVIQVDALDVPRDMLDETLSLVVGEGGAFQVFADGDEPVLKGVVGARASAGQYSLFVAQIQARPGTRFKLTRLSLDEALAALTKKYAIKERGKKSGILEVSLQGNDQDKIGVVLDDILNTYVRQNVERRSAEAENTLQFLEKQLPIVKRQLDSAEAAYNGYRQSRGSLDLNIETQSVLGSIVEIDNQIVALRQEKDELRQYFTGEHPRIQAADAKIEKLKARRSQFDGEISKLPDTQQTVLRLARDVEVNTALYTELLNTAQQLRVSKAGTVGDVRIIDSAAVTTQPVGIKPISILAIAGFLGFLTSLGVIWILRTLRVVVEDPEEIESRLGLPVYASIPHSSEEVALGRRSKGSKVSSGLLAISNPEDDAIESLRSLRTTIHFALLDSQQNSLLITGASPGLGKSFISKNLGAVLAQAGKRIVIVDADLRRGHINKEFGLKREVGISEYVAGDVSLDDIVKPTAVPNLWVVTTGQIPPNPSELLMHLRFEELLEKLGERFDTLIVDAPPILAVSDAAIIGRHVGATLMVARAGRHPIRELEQAVKRLNQSGVHVKGFVFNDFDVSRQRYRYGYKGYVYRYSYNSGSKV
ncbi:polysaccharide biosynthesis tyrosine autokinase [Zoogloea oleivorans]|uniref:Putative tyrosine-protein kinase EpsB n=1 Tax=Zoogloea oleivorans TaxID=1552750 RepID=A0A6C2CCX9_9RHOO|nr:polysaccharide biosynthesis tyrosine autokinase [Zoogloea oleivorans]TYC51818.1 polysaccharide biosynthesis tyrosine autokinase [Zoogloea oleivorans]